MIAPLVYAQASVKVCRSFIPNPASTGFFDIVVFAQNSLAPAKITRVSVTSDEMAHRPHLDVIVDNDQLSLAIGKRGLNVRLAAELIGAKIDIKSEEEVKGEVADALSAMLQEARAESRAETNVHDIEEMPEDWANTLEAAGYDDLDSVINASVEDLTAIEGVDQLLVTAELDEPGVTTTSRFSRRPNFLASSRLARMISRSTGLPLNPYAPKLKPVWP